MSANVDARNAGIGYAIIPALILFYGGQSLQAGDQLGLLIGAASMILLTTAFLRKSQITSAVACVLLSLLGFGLSYLI